MKNASCSSIERLMLGPIVCLLLQGQVARADYFFGTPRNLGPVVNSEGDVKGVSISFDGLSLYFCSDRPGSHGESDLWVTTRSTTDSDWGPPENLGLAVDSNLGVETPSISADNLTLYFNDFSFDPLPGGYGAADIWMITRPTINDPWSAPINPGEPINSWKHDVNADISADNLSLYFMRQGESGMDIWVARRTTVHADWESPVNLGPVVNTGSVDGWPAISSDERVMFFNHNPLIDSKLYMAWRSHKHAEWEYVTELGPAINDDGVNYAASVSSDGRTLYYCSTRTGGYGGLDIWEAPVLPIVDFDGNGRIDGKEVHLMATHWGEDDPLFDIGPMPWGDGIVDVHDLVVLTEYIKPIDRTLIAHWAMDETEGITAHDSVSGNDGFAVGNPVWQPAGGAIDGAIQLDGVDDYFITGSVLKSAEWPFSVLAWVKGGTPNQVVISQTMGANWLMVDAEGRLMTDLNGVGSPADSLLSQVVITDGNWHRVGFVWDGLHRTLFVDDVAVAEDTQEGLDVRGRGLYIGTGKDAASGTYWSGLVDDVRIYNRAVKP